MRMINASSLCVLEAIEASAAAAAAAIAFLKFHSRYDPPSS